MSVKIRLKRVGKKKQPSYRVVVADSRKARNGRIIERIGTYLPRTDPSVIEINEDRALDWLRQGAQPSEKVQKLLETVGVWDRFKVERPGADTAARRAIEHHRAALATQPSAPAPEPEPEPAPEPAPEGSEAGTSDDDPSGNDTSGDDDGDEGDTA